MPQLGESIAEAAIINFLVQARRHSRGRPGSHRSRDEQGHDDRDLARAAGASKNSPSKLNESYAVGAVLGQIEVTVEEAARLGLDVPAPAKTPSRNPTPDPVSKSGANIRSGRVEPTVRGLPVPANAAGASYLSPRLKARMDELGLHAADLAGVAGSGAAGRVTVEDFERFIAHLEKQKMTPASTMRVAVADAMRRSWTRPLATVGLPVCLDPLFAHRKDCTTQARSGALRPARAGGRAGGEQRASPDGWSAARLFIPPPLTSASPSRPRMACSCPSSAMPTKNC